MSRFIITGSNFKELKDGKVCKDWKFEDTCRAFLELNGRIVAFLSDQTVVVYENERPIRTCGQKCGNNYSVFAEIGRVYFRNSDCELIEWNLETFEEKIVTVAVQAMSGVPSEPNFVAVSNKGLLQTEQDEKNLSKVFPAMGKVTWDAVVSLGHFAVVTGHSNHSISNGRALKNYHNFFLLVHLASLEVLNKQNPLALEWTGDRTWLSNDAVFENIVLMRCFRRKRLHLILAMRYFNRIDLLVQLRNNLIHLDSVEAVKCSNDTLCQDLEDENRWLVGGFNFGTSQGFIKSIRIVYK